MQLAQNDKEKVKVRFNPVFIKVFLYVILLAGMFNIYKMALGHPVDIYGTMIAFLLPLIFLSFVFCKVVIEIANNEVKITKYYLMRRTTKKYDRASVKEFYIKSGKGGKGRLALKMLLEQEEVPIVSGFTQLGNAKNGEAIKALNIRLKSS
jgi:hypothetical protein